MNWLADGDKKFANWRSYRIAGASGYLVSDKPAYALLEKFFRAHTSTESTAASVVHVQLDTATRIATEGASSCSAAYSNMWSGQEPAFQLRALDLYRNWLTKDDLPALMETAFLWAVVKEWRQATAQGQGTLAERSLPDVWDDPSGA